MKAFSGESFNRVTRNTRLHLFGYEGSFSFLRECFVPLVIHPVVSDPSWAQRRRQQPFLSFTLGLLPGAFALRCVMMIRFLVAFFRKALFSQLLCANLIPVQTSGPPPHGLMIHGTLLLLMAPVFRLSPVPVGQFWGFLLLSSCPLLLFVYIITDRRPVVNTFLLDLGNFFPDSKLRCFVRRAAPRR